MIFALEFSIALLLIGTLVLCPWLFAGFAGPQVGCFVFFSNYHLLLLATLMAFVGVSGAECS